jgi:homoserine dehydrogenase
MIAARTPAVTSERRAASVAAPGQPEAPASSSSPWPAAPADPLTVLELGSSVLAREEDLPLAVHEIYRWYRAGHRVVVVVSAIGRTTDGLLDQARRASGGAELAPHGVAALVATGETAAAALLVLALDRAGVAAALLDPRQARSRTGGPPLDAGPRGLDTGGLRACLARQAVVVVPGFFGEAADGSLARFGRSGSDLTALFLAHRLGADQCRLVKDVDGIYERDPAPGGTPAPPAPTVRRYRTLAWRDAARLDGRVVQRKALAFAARRRVRFTVAAAGAMAATEVGPGPTALDQPPTARRPLPARPLAPLRVLLLGLGTVGGGVYRHLLAQLDRFAVVGAAVRDPEPHIRAGVPAALLERDPWRLLERPCDLVVEALVGTDPAARLIAAALAAGRDVVSANKEVMAGEGEWLVRHAATHGAELRFSAAVGGSVPVLEAVIRAAAAGEVRAVRGVLNGTSNFVLDRLAAGGELAAAVRLAQEMGFAEADPARDLDGRDAACKLRLLARAAFGVELAAGDLVRRGLESVDGAAAAAARERGQAIRLLAECRREGGVLRAEVRPVALPARHFLAGARGEENRVVVERVGGPPLRLAGRGAGRWPTAEAVIADVLEVMRLRHRGPIVPLAAPPRGADGAAS